MSDVAVEMTEKEEDTEIQEAEIEDSLEDTTEDELETGLEETEEESLTEGQDFGVWDENIVVRRMKVLLYGVSGTGKTTMAATFPRPLFLDLEGGMLSTRKYKPLRYPADPNEDIKAYPEVIDFYKLVKKYTPETAPFETIVIDSLNELQLLVAQYVIEKYTGVKRQYNDQPTMADYGKANRMFMQVTRLFLKLPYHIIFTAISNQKETGDEDIQVAPKFVGKQVGPDIQRMMDMVGYCHAKRVQDGSSQHYVSFKITPQYLAKDRLDIVLRDIPNSYEALISNSRNKGAF